MAYGVNCMMKNIKGGIKMMRKYKEAMFWQQVTPWYMRLGNLKRFHPEYF